MLKNLSFIALLGIAVVGVPSELSAKNVKVAGTQKGAAAKSITRQVAQQNVTIEFYSPSIVRILKSDAGLGAPVQKKSYSVILKPQHNGTFIFFHLSGNQSHISAVVHIMMPIILQSQFRLLILGINHQARCITVKSVYYMRLAVLASLMKIIIKHRFHIQSRMTGYL